MGKIWSLRKLSKNSKLFRKTKHWDVWTSSEPHPNWYLYSDGIYVGDKDGNNLEKYFDWE